MSKFLGDNGGFQKLIELIKTALGLKVSLSNDLSFSAPAYSSANVGKYAVVLSVPTNRRLTLSISSNANGYGSSNVVYLVGGHQNSSAYQLLGDGGFAIRHDIQAGKVYLCVPCLSSQYAPRKTHNAQVLFYSESDRTEIVVPQTQTIYDGDWIDKAQTIYTAPLKDTQPFNVSSAGVGSINLENYSSFLGKCPSEMDSVTIHVDNELAGQIYNLTFDHDVTDGITIDDGLSTPTVYCAISESVKAGDVITLTAASNTSNGWIYSHIGAPIESPDGSILVEISDGVTKLKVDPDKLTLPDDVLRNHSTVGSTPNDRALAIGYNSQCRYGGDVSIGSDSTASGIGSTALGQDSTASGFCSTAIGSYSTASGFDSTAIGSQSTASGFGSTALGQDSTASGSDSTASGYNSTASGSCSTASGSGSAASGDYSIAIGVGANATADRQIVLGAYNLQSTTDLFQIGNGSGTERRNLLVIDSNKTMKGLVGVTFEPYTLPYSTSSLGNKGIYMAPAGTFVNFDNQYAYGGRVCWVCALGNCTVQGKALQAGAMRPYIGEGGVWYEAESGGGGGSSFVESVGIIDAVSGSTQTSEERKAIINSNTVINIRHDLNLTLSIPSSGIKEGARRIFFKKNVASSNYYLRIYFDVMTDYIELEDGVPYLFEFHDGEWRHVEGAILNEELKRMLMIQTTIGNYSETNYSHTSGSVSAQGKVQRLYKINSAPSSGGSSQSPFIDVSYNFYSKRSGGSSFNELMMDSYFNRLSPYINLDGETVSRMIEWYCKPSVLKINDTNVGAYYNSATKTLTISQPVRMVAFETTGNNYPEIEKICGIEQDGYRLTIIPNGRCYLKESTGDYRFSSRLYQYVHDNGTSSSQSTHFDEAYIEVVQYNKVWLTKTY